MTAERAPVEFHTWLAFAAALLVTLAIPGPDFVVIVQATLRSARSGLLAAAGVSTGLLIHTGLAVAGIAALVATLPGALLVLRIVGSAVLLWLGVSMLRGWRKAGVVIGVDPQAGAKQAHDGGLWPNAGSFLRGFLSNVTNPKALLFFAAILPQFIGTGAGMGFRTAFLCATVVLGSSLWSLGTIGVIRILKLERSARADRMTTLAGGLTLVVLAGFMGFSAAAG